MSPAWRSVVLAATAKAAAEQGQDLTDTLLGDLALEHELLDRARFAKMLAEQLGRPPHAGCSSASRSPTKPPCNG